MGSGPETWGIGDMVADPESAGEFMKGPIKYGLRNKPDCCKAGCFSCWKTEKAAYRHHRGRHHHEHLDAYLLQPKSSTCCWLRSSRSVRNQRGHGGSQRSNRNRHPPEFVDPYLHLLCRTWCMPTQCQD